MNASDVMVRDVVTIGPDDEISTQCGCLPITTSALCRSSMPMAMSSAFSAKPICCIVKRTAP